MLANQAYYDQLIVYYFSGTGNAKKSAEWIAEAGRKAKLKTHLINIDRFETINIPSISGKVLIGFCTPTHGFNIPPIMIDFIAKFPGIKDADVFILNTRAGMKLYKLFVTGLSGIAQFLPAIMLRSKGFRVVGMQPVDLPSNWLIIHPGLRKKVVLSLFKKHRRVVTQFADTLIRGGTKYRNAFWSLPVDLLIAPISIGYYFIGRFFLAKTLIATDKCDACMLCVKNCPVEAIKWIDDRPFWTFKCESCMRCVNQCPERAIETAHSFTAFVIYMSSVLTAMLTSVLLVNTDILSPNRNSWWWETIEFTLVSIIMVLLIYIGYRILHYMMRYKWFNRFIAYTSLSKYKWWRRYWPKKILRGNE